MGVHPYIICLRLRDLKMSVTPRTRDQPRSQGFSLRNGRAGKPWGWEVDMQQNEKSAKIVFLEFTCVLRKLWQCFECLKVCHSGLYWTYAKTQIKYHISWDKFYLLIKISTLPKQALYISQNHYFKLVKNLIYLSLKAKWGLSVKFVT